MHSSFAVTGSLKFTTLVLIMFTPSYNAVKASLWMRICQNRPYMNCRSRW